MPELVPAWQRMVELAGGGDLAARMLTLCDTPPLITGCSQAVFPASRSLVRNYDWDPTLLEGVILRTRADAAARARHGRLPVGAARRRSTTPGSPSRSRSAAAARSAPASAMPIVVRYLLETCATTAAARAGSSRGCPCRSSYNLTIVDRERRRRSPPALAPDRAPRSEPVAAGANHQGRSSGRSTRRRPPASSARPAAELLAGHADDPARRVPRAAAVQHGLRRTASGRCTRPCIARRTRASSTAGRARAGVRPRDAS